MNNPNPKLRYALGISALTALSLAMVGCGGSSSSAPAAATNQSPSAPGITATGLQITGHPMTFNLSAVDPEGDQITFTVSGAATASVGPTSGSGSFTFTPAVQSTPSSQSLSLSVIAKDSKGASSAATPFNWTEAPNHGPQFFSLDTPPVFAGGSPTIAVSYTVVSQDQDTDDVRYDALTVVSMTDNNGNAYTGAAPSINTTTGVITWAGTVPSTAVSVTAKVDVTAKDYLPGTTTAVGGSTVQHLTLTYNSGNTPPVITTNSLPPLAANHYIPTKKGDPGYQIEALDANALDTLTWRVVSPAGFKLVAGADQYHKYLVSDTGFTPQAAGGSYTVVIGVSDGHNPEVFKTNTISVITDAVPTLNSNDYTETVSGVVAFDSSRVKNDLAAIQVAPGLTKRGNFYPGNIDWTGFAYVNTPSAVFTPNRTAPYLGTAETTGGIDADATNNAFSNYANAYPAGFLGPLADESFPALGWNARTVFKDGESDKILYSVLPGSVFVAGTPYNTVGQTFTLSPSTLPLIPGGAVGAFYGNSSPNNSEYPMVNANDGTIQWRPVMTSEAGMGFKFGDVFGGLVTDNFGNSIWSQASTWSFIVQATERVYDPLLEPAPDPYVTIPANKGQIQYVIKVQPNNAPWIGPLTTIPNATTTVAGNPLNEVVNPTTTLSIGGGASIAVAPTWY
ncbi:MAG: hypothetical protein KGN80_06300, partial [Acidobacteriota bacterium]|nr:hypothetical protein [Acidobacteriota bacterium]